ncbi:Cytochrome C553 (soluble cytochrome f) [hydrothermal vent metagenome]|uniref:Cytochrome C553 (Soluble cytochrome f) n=1 Tax=hydrothermal vent metagenome TaxID=652676 RepID=A0A1W1C6Y1_9ZZZZ
MKKLIIGVALLTATNLIADVKAGEQVYKANCAICHTVNGGSALGPDFNIVSYTRKKSQIEQYVKDPYSLYKEFGYSANAMPTLPLEEQEFKDVAEYISSLQPFKKWMIKKKPTKKILVKNSDNNISSDG